MRIAVGLVAIIALQLAGCGFHLRGSPGAGGTPALPFAVAIDDKARATAAGNWLGGGPGELARIFGDTFAAAGTTPADDAPVRVELLSESIGKRVASVDATASAAEYQLNYSLLFRVSGSDGATLVAPTWLKLDRSYRHKADAIMGSAEEEALLQRDLRRDAAMQVLRRLRSIAAQPAAAAAAGNTPPSPLPTTGNTDAPGP